VSETETVTVEKPRQRIVRLAPVAPQNGAPGMKIMLECGHIFTAYGVTMEVADGTLECARCQSKEGPRTCAYCEELLLPNERIMERGEGFTQGYHEECDVRAHLGSAAHFMKECACYGGTRSDPPEMSKRDAARMAFEAREHMGKASGGKADIAAVLQQALGESGRVVDLGTFRVGDDGRLEPSDGEDDDEE
jgi:hypothetical protein